MKSEETCRRSPKPYLFREESVEVSKKDITSKLTSKNLFERLRSLCYRKLNFGMFSESLHAYYDK